MFEIWGIVCLLTLMSAGFALLATEFILPFCIQNARRWGSLDTPDKRKVHKFPTPRLGGVGVAPAIWFSCAMSLIVMDRLGPQMDFPMSFPLMITGLLIGCAGVFVIGLLDDIRSIAAAKKLIAQSIVAVVVLAFLPVPTEIMGIGIHPSLALFAMFSWLVIIPNSVNLMDGVDGLTSAMLLVFLATVSIIALVIGQPLWLMISIPTAFSIVGFLRFNWSPAKIFLGDSGSLSLGFVVAFLSLGVSLQMGSTKSSGSNWSLWLSLLLVSVWLADTSLAIARRYLARAPKLRIFLKRSKVTYFLLHHQALKGVMRPDCKHIHHIVLKMGFDAKGTVFVIASVLLAMHSFALAIWLWLRVSSSHFVMSDLLPSLLAVGAFVLLFGVYRQVSSQRQQRDLQPVEKSARVA
jgi:UDP-GlcNAc:undecaprenyl-phosphate GlcNAc-1-phosphate transferase